MLNNHKLISAGTAALILGLGTAGASTGAGQSTSTSDPVHCEIQTSTGRGMTTMEGLVFTDAKISGSYQFRVMSSGRSGNSNIRQGGNFTATPDNPVTLGKIMLGNRGASYNATLKVTVNGTTIKCDEHVGEEI